MAGNLREMLEHMGVLASVALPAEIDMLLKTLMAVRGPDKLEGDWYAGDLEIDGNLGESPIPGFNLSLTVPTDVVEAAPFRLMLERSPAAAPGTAPDSFRLWIVLAKQGQACLGFKFIERLPGLGMQGAMKKETAEGTRLEPTGVKPILVSRSGTPGAELGPAILITGGPSKPATLRLVPDTSSEEGVFSIGLEPETVVFGDTGIGFTCPAFTIDDSTEHSAPGKGVPGLDPPKEKIDADDPAWRGLLARQLDFYLPADLPFFGGRPISAYVAIPRDAGPQVVIETRVPAQASTDGKPGRPGYSVRIECIDPGARGLSGLMPTLIRASMQLPLDRAQEVAGGTVEFAAGKPVQLALGLAREPASDTARISFAIFGQGSKGIVSLASTSANAAKYFNIAAAMATSLIADANPPRDAPVGSGTGVPLPLLAGLGMGASALFQDETDFVLNGVELESQGHGLPLGGKIVAVLDYSVAVRVVKISIPGGAVGVEMDRNQPMRIRIRRAKISIDPAKSGLEMVGLDFDRAETEIENPGKWNVSGLEQLFDAMGSRSGRGSTWIEADLRFKLNLGPIKVSGLTIRATFKKDDPDPLQVTVTGITAGINIPSAVAGEGAVHLIPDGFDARLGARIVPMKLAADAAIRYSPNMLALELGVDLPAPIPLANTGLGLFGVGGMAAFSAEPNYRHPTDTGTVQEQDPVLRQLRWDPKAPDAFTSPSAQSTFGFSAVIGTLPDLGFTFSAKTGLIFSVPDVAVRGALNGRILSPVAKMSDPSVPADPMISFLGFIGIDSTSLDFAVIGTVDLKPLLLVKIPVVGHFPFNTPDWHLYLGADGYPFEGRQIGPVTATVLPGLLDIHADAYLMARGKGITGWPHGRPLPAGPLTLEDGFVVAFGFAAQCFIGAKPIAWADLHASLDLLLGTKPLTLAGFGHAGGSLNLGPFSLGVKAQLSFIHQEAAPPNAAKQYLWAKVTGRIDLFFCEIEGSVEMSFGTQEPPEILPPARHPLDRYDAENQRIGSTAVLTDDSYRSLAYLVEDPNRLVDSAPPGDPDPLIAAPVWPDAMISLPFSVTPSIGAGATKQFTTLRDTAPRGQKTIGTEMLTYRWQLDKVALVDVTGEQDKTNPEKGAPVATELAASWQTGRHAAGDVTELILLSEGNTLWVNRTADAGKDLPTDPLGQEAGICRLHVDAEVGWAVGQIAKPEATGFCLPCDPISSNPLRSRIVAHLHHTARPWDSGHEPIFDPTLLPTGYSLTAASTIDWNKQLDPGVGREFGGHLTAPNLAYLPGLDPDSWREERNRAPYLGQSFRLDLETPITGGLLVLTGDEQHFAYQEGPDGVSVTDEHQWGWTPIERTEGPDGSIQVVYQQTSPSPVEHVRVDYPLSAAIGIVGLGGLTTEATAAADAENTGTGNRRDRLAAAAAPREETPRHGQGPPPGGAPAAPLRNILQPGRMYRLEIGMTWFAELYEQDETGARSKKPTTKQGTETRMLFFHTAPPATDPPPHPLEVSYTPWMRKRDVFAPAMLDRYLAGYEPAQSDMFFFRRDPLKAHFTQDHVQNLAKAYGFTLELGLRRIDQPAGNESNDLMLMEPRWTPADNPHHLLAADRVRFERAFASPCTVPTPGATAQVPTALAPQAWYEAFVQATPQPGKAFSEGRLPGLTFRTSRWDGPADMLAGLGLLVPGHSTSLGGPQPGDLAVDLAGTGEGTRDQDTDHGFENTLAGLGVSGWPTTNEPRLSRIWVPDPTAGWLFAGLMIESPEPIHRPGRIEVPTDTTELWTSAGRQDIRFGLHRDRTGSRLLWLTESPATIHAGSATHMRIAIITKTAHPAPPEPTVAGLNLPDAPAFTLLEALP